MLPLGLEGRSVLQHLIERIIRAKTVDEVLIVTTDNGEDDVLEDFAEFMGCLCYRGKNKYVLDNVLEACEKFSVDVIVDVTADCPLIDPRHIDVMVRAFRKYRGQVSYVSNVIRRTYPRGFDLQVYSAVSLKLAAERIVNEVHRNHTGWNIMLTESLHKMVNFVNKKERKEWRLCIDEEADYNLLKMIFNLFLIKIYGHQDNQ